MRLLLDENLPKRIKLDFTDHEIYTVRDRQWNGIKNGQSMKLLLDNSVDALLTFDKNLQHQQNFTKYSITVFVLIAEINSYNQLTKLSPKVKEYLNAGSLTIGPASLVKTKGMRLRVHPIGAGRCSNGLQFICRQ